MSGRPRPSKARALPRSAILHLYFARPPSARASEPLRHSHLRFQQLPALHGSRPMRHHSSSCPQRRMAASVLSTHFSRGHTCDTTASARLSYAPQPPRLPLSVCGGHPLPRSPWHSPCSVRLAQLHGCNTRSRTLWLPRRLAVATRAGTPATAPKRHDTYYVAVS
jgi:hypothetical protein